MKYVPGVSGRAVLALAIIAVNSLLTANAQTQSGQVSIQSVRGSATYESLGQVAQLQPNQVLFAGSILRTAPDATVDLILQYNGTALRLLPNSVLSLDKLNKESAGEETITETSLNLRSGSLIGSQRKLAPPSRFDINIPGGTATIKGTIYDVRADGAVTCISGEVQVTLTQDGVSTIVTVPAGYSYDPASGKVVKTSANFLKNIIAHVDKVKETAEVFKASGLTVLVTPNQRLTPTKGNNGVGNGTDGQPPGNPPVNDGPGTGPGNPGKRPHGTTNSVSTVRSP